MEKNNQINKLVASVDVADGQLQALQDFEVRVLQNMGLYGLPTSNILVPLEERIVVFKNVETILNKIPEAQRAGSVYFSKLLAAAASGLFDAGLNYLWDETISEIRKRVIKYDVQYFYENATSNEEKRKKLKSGDDIVNLDDNELIIGARKIGLISGLGYKHLDYIRYMRNWASAAHPNQNQITGLQLISWLETCIKEVISLPLSNIVIETQQLLKNIKTNELSDTDAQKIAIFFVKLEQHQVNNLASGFFGIYLDSDSSPFVIQNICYLLPYLWGRVDEEHRQQFGIKYGNFIANNDSEKTTKTKNFLEIVGGLTYLPDDIKIFEIETAMQNLLNIHGNINNFYNEPIFARQLFGLISGGLIPKKIRRFVVFGVVKVFLTNGNGVANSAEPCYLKIIKNFDQREALLALVSFFDEEISSRLQFSLCQKKFKELLTLIKGKLLVSAIKELYEEVNEYPGPLDRIRYNSNIIRMFDNVKVILKS